MRLRDTGILLYPPIVVSPTSIDLSFDECREQIRLFLTYFDRIKAVGLNHVLVPGGMVNFASTEMQNLVQKKTISSVNPRYVHFGKPGLEYLTTDIEQTYFDLNRGDDPVWAVAPPRDLVSGHTTGVLNTLTLDMLNVLPVPEISVPIDEVIAFRNANLETLRTLHQRIDEIFAGNYDDPKTALSRMYEPISEIETYLKKFKFPYFKVKLSASQFVSSSVLEVLFGLVGSALGVPFSLGAKLAGFFSFAYQDVSLARPENSFPKDFQYVYRGRSLDILTPSLNSYPAIPDIKIPLHTFSRLLCGFPKETIPETQIKISGVSHGTVHF